MGLRKYSFLLFANFFPIFVIKKKNRAYKQNLRHGSLQMGLKNVQTKFEPYICYSFFRKSRSKNDYQNLDFLTYHHNAALIAGCNKMSLISQNSLGSQLSIDVS